MDEHAWPTLFLKYEADMFFGESMYEADFSIIFHDLWVDRSD
jgi:hypothetical protein